MSDGSSHGSIRLLRSLIDALEAGGQAAVADEYRDRYERQNWATADPDDVREILALIERGYSGAYESLEEVDEDAVDTQDDIETLDDDDDPTDSDEPLGWSPVLDHGAFVDALPSGRLLLERVNRLAMCADAAAAARAIRGIFVDCLGFDEVGVDELDRLPGVRSFRGLEVIARFEDFTVSLVEMAYPLKYVSTINPVFQLHPYGLVVAVSPQWRSCRLCFRMVAGSEAGQIRYRTLCGGREGRDPLDNLVVWARRLSLLRPGFEDDRSSLLERTQIAFTASPVDLGTGWRSAPLHGDGAPPGTAWADAPRAALEAFLQPDVPSEARWFWGLERVLRQRFPISVAGGRAQLHYRGYEVEAEEAAAEGGAESIVDSAYRRIVLLLQLEDLDAESTSLWDLRIPAGAPTVDRHGRLRIRGQDYRFVPSVLESGRLATSAFARVIETEADEEIWEIVADADLGVSSPSPPESVGVADPGLEFDLDDEIDQRAAIRDVDEGAPGAIESANLCTLLEIATVRKLGALAFRSYSLDAEQDPMVGIGGILLSLAGSDGLLGLCSKVFLQRALLPVPCVLRPSSRLPILRLQAANQRQDLPSWGCPDLCLDLPHGELMPVAGARLAPWGGLVTPMVAGDQRVLGVDDRPAWGVNPRCGGSGTGPREWWIGQPLVRHADLDAGVLQSASWIAAFGKVLPGVGPVVRVPGPRLRARFRPDAVERRQVERQVSATVPWPYWVSEESAPTILVEVGQPLEPGDPWLEVSPDLFERTDSRTPAPLPSCWLAAEAAFPYTAKGKVRHLAGHPKLSSLDHRTLPPGLAGIVTETKVEEVRDHRGLRTAWRARITLAQTRPTIDGHLVLDDGRVAPVVVDLSREEAPFDATGAPAVLVIEDPRCPADAEFRRPWFDGRTGDLEPAAIHLSSTIEIVPAPVGAPVVQPDWTLRRRARDGEGIPAHPSSAGLTARDRNLWHAVDPSGAAQLAAMERAWNGGEPPFWSRLRGLLTSAMVTPPSLAPPDRLSWTGARVARDPLKLLTAPQIHRLRPLSWTGRRSPVDHSCACGRLRGPHTAFEVCARCGTPAVCSPDRRRPGKVPAIDLPEPIPHPWRITALATLLGWTAAEFARQFAEHGGEWVVQQATAAMHSPLSRVEARLHGLDKRAERLEVTAGILALDAELLTPGFEHRAFLERVAFLPAALHPCGAVGVSAWIVASPITRNYRLVHNAAHRLRVFLDRGIPLLEETARLQLWAAVGELYGSADVATSIREPVDLAGLLTRIWPVSRSPRLRSVVPGMFRIVGRPAPDDPRDGDRSAAPDVPLILLSPAPPAAEPYVPGQRKVTEEPAPAEPMSREAQRVLRQGTIGALVRRLVESAPDEVVPATMGTPVGEWRGIHRVTVRISARSPSSSLVGVLTPGGPVYQPDFRAVAHGRPTEAGWREWAARGLLTDQFLLPLQVIVGAMAPFDEDQQESTGWLRHPGAGKLGPLLHRYIQTSRRNKYTAPTQVQALVAALHSPRSAPSALLDILTGSLPMQPGQAWEDAQKRLADPVIQAFPGEGGPIAAGRRTLVEALGGWWTVKPGVKHPTGWTWLPPKRRPGMGSRRFVPPLSTAAWDLWPGMLAVRSPVRFFIEHQSQPVLDTWNPMLVSLAGLRSGDDLAAFEDLDQAPPADATADEKEPRPFWAVSSPIEGLEVGSAMVPEGGAPAPSPDKPAPEITIIPADPEHTVDPVADPEDVPPPIETVAAEESPREEIRVLHGSIEAWLKGAHPDG